LNNKLVTHRFVYFEEWIKLKTSNENKLAPQNIENQQNTLDSEKKNEFDEPILDQIDCSKEDKYLRQCYFGKYVVNNSKFNYFSSFFF
jgi:hypothetical protein